MSQTFVLRLVHLDLGGVKMIPTLGAIGTIQNLNGLNSGAVSYHHLPRKRLSTLGGPHVPPTRARMAGLHGFPTASTIT